MNPLFIVAVPIVLLIVRFQKVVCVIRGHKLKVITKDILWECERCEATFLRKGLLNGIAKGEHGESAVEEMPGDGSRI